MTDPVTRLNAALEGRYAIERELGEGGMATVYLFYVMPYVEGESLREKLDGEHQLSVDEALRLPTDVAEAL